MASESEERETGWVCTESGKAGCVLWGKWSKEGATVADAGGRLEKTRKSREERGKQEASTLRGSTEGRMDSVHGCSSLPKPEACSVLEEGGWQSRRNWMEVLCWKCFGGSSVGGLGKGIYTGVNSRR